METRTIEQIKVYSLHLNEMRGQFENTSLVAISISKEELLDWCETLKGEPYQDESWGKQFQKDSPLEWYNPIEWSEYCGIRSEWTEIEATKNYIIEAQSSFGFTTTPEIVGVELRMLVGEAIEE